MGYPLFNSFLPQYLQNAGKNVAPTPNDIVYRNYAITSIVGVPGSFIAAYTVDVKFIGRKGTIAVSALITGTLLFCFTISSEPNFQLIFSSLEAFFQSRFTVHATFSRTFEMTDGIQISCMACSMPTHLKSFQLPIEVRVPE